MNNLKLLPFLSFSHLFILSLALSLIFALAPDLSLRPSPSPVNTRQEHLCTLHSGPPLDDRALRYCALCLSLFPDLSLALTHSLK
jgi:hypothetical protein